MKEKNKAVQKTWKDYVYVLLEVLIIGSGFYQLFFAETVIGLLTLIAMVPILYPHFVSRGLVTKLPKEIVIILFVMVFFQLVLGEARDFYVEVPYYDKLVHWMLPMFLGFIAFLIFYTMQTTGNLRASNTVIIILVVLISLGIGAFWEILEYANDRWLLPHMPNGHSFQGNAEQSKIDDTMTDLIMDTLGGIFGAFLALWYTNKGKLNKSKDLENLTSDLAENYNKPNKSKKKS